MFGRTQVFALLGEIKGYLQLEEDPRDLSRLDALNLMFEAAHHIDSHLARSLDEVCKNYIVTSSGLSEMRDTFCCLGGDALL